MPPQTDVLFEYDGDPVEIVGGAPYAAGLGIIDIPIMADVDPFSSITHYRVKFHATQDTPESLYYFNMQLYSSSMEADDYWSGSYLGIQDGWIGEAGESWGTSSAPEDRVTFVSDHAYYGTTESDWDPPDHAGAIYQADNWPMDWEDDVLPHVAEELRIPGGGDWFLRLTLPDDAPGNVTLHDFSVEITYQEYRPRFGEGGQFIGPIPLTQGWVCSNDYPAPLELWCLLHRGQVFLYGNMLDWYNWNEEEDEEWFTEFYDDFTDTLVEAGGLPERVRPASNIQVPFHWYPFSRSSAVMGERWNLLINTDGSIKFGSPSGKKLRVGGGDYSFAPMQIRWPVGSGGPDSKIWEEHNELVNESGGTGDNEEWTVGDTIELASHGGIAHLRGSVSHSDKTQFPGLPLRHVGGVHPDDWVTGDINKYAPVKLLRLEDFSVTQDFGFIQQFGSDIPISNPTGSATVQFDASPTRGNKPLTYEWDFGDGGSGTGISPTHDYDAAGDYSVTLTVTDERGKTGQRTKTVTIESSDLGESILPNPYSTYVNHQGAVINSPGSETFFLSGNPETQVFKGGSLGPWVIGEPLPDLREPLDRVFSVDKYRVYSGIRQAAIGISSPQMDRLTPSGIGYKYGVMLCLQEDGSHYRHEVECTAVNPGAVLPTLPNTYEHKLYKGATQIGSTVTNNDPTCGLAVSVNFSDVQKVRWQYSYSDFGAEVTDDDVAVGGGWGFLQTESVEINSVHVTGNEYPLIPDEGEQVTFDCWWPVFYEFDEFSS